MIIKVNKTGYTPTPNPNPFGQLGTAMSFTIGNNGLTDVAFTLTTSDAQDYVVNWGDDNSDTVNSGSEATHTYAGGSTYNGTIDTDNTILTFGIGGNGDNNQPFETISFNSNRGEGLTSLANAFGISEKSGTSTCPHLTTVTLPSSLKSLTSLDNAFVDASSLSTIINFPTSLPVLTTLQQAFTRCYSLTSITLPASMPNLTTMYETFFNCTSLTSVTLPTSMDGITNMRDLFNGCANLPSVPTFPSSLPVISNIHGMFENCDSLTTITLPDVFENVTTLGNLAYACNNLTNATLPATMDSATPGSTFQLCTNLTSVTMPTSMNGTTSMSWVFRDSSVTSITLPTSMTSLVGLVGTFTRCHKLTSVTMNSVIQSSGVLAMTDTFDNCDSLTTVDIRNSTCSSIGINSIFAALPSQAGTIYITDASGAVDASTKIAEDKGWTVIN